MLVIFGATLIVWVVSDEWLELPGFTTFPSTAPGQVLIGGPSNAGGLFVDWVRARSVSPIPDGRPEVGRPGHPAAGPATRVAVPVWLPYLRGERTPFHDPWLRASLHGLDITRAPHRSSAPPTRRAGSWSGG